MQRFRNRAWPARHRLSGSGCAAITLVFLVTTPAYSQNLLLRGTGLASPDEREVTSLQSKDEVAAAEADHQLAVEAMRRARDNLQQTQRRLKIRNTAYETRIKRLQERYDETYRRVQQAEKVLQQAKANRSLVAYSSAERTPAQRQANIDRALETAGQIDAYFEKRWQEKNLLPADLADDAAFLRRAFLDIVGTIPKPQQFDDFRADSHPEKRAQWVDRLLLDPPAADYWGLRIRSWILEQAPVVGQGANTVTLFEYLREAVALDVSYAEIARDLITSKGHSARDGAVVYPILWEAKPAELAAATSSIFLGVNIQCAQCHDDMIEGWTQEDFWGMAAFFTGIESEFDGNETAYPKRPTTSFHQTHLIGGREAIPGHTGDPRAIQVTVDTQLEIADPTEKKPKRFIGPKPLGEARTMQVPNGQRRDALVTWMTNPGNPYFDRAVVNRVWSHFFGRGFVPTADGFQPSATVLHEELLQELCADFVRNDRKLRHLIRSIVSSKTYQRAIREDATAAEEYTAALLRPLDGDQWVNSLFRATGYEDFLGNPANYASQPRLLWDLRWFRYGLAKKTGPVAQSLLELNTYWLQRSTADGITIASTLALPEDKRVAALFRHALAREPSEEEAAMFQSLAGTQDGVEDILRVLLGSTEFVTH